MLLLVGLAAMSLFRIVSQWRRVSRPKDDDWDARFIGQLRKAGIAPFESYPVDFFFDLPSQQACDEVGDLLRAEGYEVDSRAEADTGRFSLHANFSMRLLVDEMKALTLRFRALAAEKGGKYDGWAVGKGSPRKVR
jgi:hypothetical protein